MKGLLTSLITVLTFTGLQAQSLPTAPKLVVGLTIDQLRTDYLEAFSSLYGERGFKRLWKEGRVFHNAEYTFSGVDLPLPWQPSTADQRLPSTGSFPTDGWM